MTIRITTRRRLAALAVLLPMAAIMAVAWGCGGASVSVGASASTASGAGGDSREAWAVATDGTEIPRQHWMNPPAPIEGKWEVKGCQQKTGMIIEFVLGETKNNLGHVVVATGRVVDPGGAARYGYVAGESMFTGLEANLYGNWRGQHKWRSVLAVERWDPIYITIDGENLSATMTTDSCLKTLVRVP